MSGRNAFTIAKTATGREIEMRLNRCPQILAVGASGSGKTACVQRMLLEVAKLNTHSEAPTAIIICDPKQVGYMDWGRCAYVYDSPRDFLRVGNALVNESERRYFELKRQGSSVFTPSAKHPPIFVVVDECPDFFNSTELIKAQRTELQECFVKLSNKARGCGFSVCYASQSPLVEALPGAIRNNCGNRMVFKLNSPEMAKAATSDRVEEANPVLLTMPGEGFFLTDATGGYYERGRVLMVSDEERERVLAQTCDRPYLFALDFDNPEYRG